jgi:hypothetical protein
MVITANSSSASQPKLSAAGSAHVMGLAILANPRRIPVSKTIVFDTQLYLGPTCQDILIGSLRYFNSADLSFEDGPELYCINSTVSIISIIYFLINKLSFSLLDEVPLLMCRFQATEHFRITHSSVTYSL